MNNFIEENVEDQFANGQSRRDLRDSFNVTEPETQLDVKDLRECTDSNDWLKALRKNSGEDLNRRIERPDEAEGQFKPSPLDPLLGKG
jgi:hypothetical protein